jgi:peroxiredoxin
VAQLRARQSDFEKAGARVVLAGMGTPAECTAFQRKFLVPFPMISDPDRTLYRRFHLQRMSPLGVFSPAVALKSIAAMARGHKIGKPQGDILQLPGVFVIATGGRIVISHQPDSPADHADPDTLLDALARLGSNRPPA